MGKWSWSWRVCVVWVLRMTTMLEAVSMEWGMSPRAADAK
jgi:hypothetical protein